MASANRTQRRRAVVVGCGVVALAVNFALGGPAMHRLPYLLAVLTVLFLMQTFWEERVTAGSWLGLGTLVLLLAMAASINFSVNRNGGEQRAESPTTTVATAAAPSDTTTTLLSGTDVPARVAGAVETRTEADRLVACESALEQIAAAIRAAGNAVDADITEPPADGVAPAPAETARRLESCDVRLQAIAETLPR